MNFQCRSATPPPCPAPREEQLSAENRRIPAFVERRAETGTIVASPRNAPPAFLSFYFFPLDLTAVSHQNRCLKDIAKMSVSVSQLVSQAANNLLAIPPCPISSGRPDLCPFVPVAASGGHSKGRGPAGLAPSGGAGGGNSLPRRAIPSSEGDGENPGPVTRAMSWPSPHPRTLLLSSHLKVKETSKVHISSDMKAPSFGGGPLSTVPNYACPVLAA